MTAPPVRRLQTTTTAGERVEVWCSESEPTSPSIGTAVVAPGYGRRVHHLAPFASYLNAQGVVVYRFDHVDHRGHSDGDPRRFTLSAMYRGLQAVVRTAARNGNEVALVTASIASRCAFRLAAENEPIAQIISLVGVVDIRATMAAVFGHDYSTTPPEITPEHVEFEGQDILVAPFWQDVEDHGWRDLDGTVADLRRATIPIVNFLAQSDDWVDAAAVKEAFTRGTGGPRRLYELAFVEHDLARNPVAAREVLRLVTRAVLTGDPESPVEILEPTFKQLAARVVAERRFERTIRTLGFASS